MTHSPWQVRLRRLGQKDQSETNISVVLVLFDDHAAPFRPFVRNVQPWARTHQTIANRFDDWARIKALMGVQRNGRHLERDQFCNTLP